MISSIYDRFESYIICGMVYNRLKRVKLVRREVKEGGGRGGVVAPFITHAAQQKR